MPITSNVEGALGFVMMALSFALLALWITIAWRAMRAHERLANAVERIAREERARGLS